jgi:hypothetical protein
MDLWPFIEKMRDNDSDVKVCFFTPAMLHSFVIVCSFYSSVRMEHPEMKLGLRSWYPRGSLISSLGAVLTGTTQMVNSGA